MPRGGKMRVGMNRIILVMTAIILSFSSAVMSSESDEISKVKEILAKMIPNEKPDAVTKSPLPGLYEVIYGPEVMYVSGDGRFLVQGDLVDLESKKNLTEEKRSAGRRKLIASIDPSTMITFSPKNVKHVVTVFTDLDCPYCRKMHSEIADYNQRGIEIRYLAFPRSGLNTPSYFKAVSVWCSKDRKEALTIAKAGGKVDEHTCDNPVRSHMMMGSQVGVTGTPTLVLEDGSVMPGYVPAQQLSELLDERMNKNLSLITDPIE